MSFPYNLDHADKTYILDKKLNEISGINFIKKNHLYCIHDESKDIYELKKSTIINHFQSKSAADIEDIVVIGKKAYLLDAKKCFIYEYKNFRKSMQNPQKHKLHLDKKFDPEGLCYDKQNKCLLIACKGNPQKSSHIRSVFKFDLTRNKRCKNTYFKIDIKNFNPSGIAINPITQEIYLIGSRGLKIIIYLDKTGRKILGKKELNKNQFRQPEGITFSKKGELFISNEKKKKIAAKIFKFK